MKQKIMGRCKQLLDAIKKEKLFYLFALLSVVAAGTFVCIMYTRTLPYAEGWYTYYARCIHQGVLPYRDFEYLYPPVYIYTVALITKLFGFDLIVLRRLGIVIFAAIALVLYLCVTEIVGKKRSWIALVASVTAVFYLQSEVVQSFYDYVRLMDLVAALALLFLLRTTKAILEERCARGSLITLGIFTALLVNIKQNVGLIFFAAVLAIVLYLGLWKRLGRRRILKSVAYLAIPVAAIEALVLLLLLATGSLSGYLSMTGLSAAGAKGGIQAILFGWIVNNIYAFRDSLLLAFCLIGVIVGLYFVRKRLNTDDVSEGKTFARLPLSAWIGIGFTALMLIGLALLALSKGFAKWFTTGWYLSPYAIFLVVFPLFFAMGVWGIVDIARRRTTMQDAMLPFVLSAAYFAIAFSCGNSGGIAEGQSSFGVAFIVTMLLMYAEELFSALPKKPFVIARYAVTGAAVLLFAVLTLQNADKKMLDTYNWWGMTEADYWESTQEMTLPLTKGIKVSPDTKALYEGVCNAIMDNTDQDDPIFCFPQIPLIYSICDRSDPGTATKVQWFDVASDAAVRADIEVIKQNPPKAIVIYNTAEGAYNAHEHAFRGDQTSATREMREFLYNFAAENGYRFHGRFVSGNNSISLWLADETAPTTNFGGTGTLEDPFTIGTKEQFMLFCDMVNGGRTFEGQYIRQTADLDLGGMTIAPIGAAGMHSYFSGVYDGAGHVIRNLTVAGNPASKESVGLFGALAGSVYNLGVLDMTVSGTYCGGIAGAAAHGGAKIVNCFVLANLSGERAGGIADDFSGHMENCITLGSLTGTISANAVSKSSAAVLKNVFVDKSLVYLHPDASSEELEEKDRIKTDERIVAVSRDTLNSAALADILNANVDLFNKKELEKDEEERLGITLLYWQVGANGHLVLTPAA